MKLPLWSLIPALMIFTVTYFIAFSDYTVYQWIMGNGIVAVGITAVYGGMILYEKLRRKDGD